MICFSQMNAFCNRLPHKIARGDLANDKWVVENYLYGIDFYSSGSEVLVFVGARFGLEAIVAYYNFKPREIIVIEEDEYKLAIFDSLLNKNPEMKSRVSVFTDIKSPEIIAKLEGNAPVRVYHLTVSTSTSSIMLSRIGSWITSVANSMNMMLMQ